MTLSVDMQSPTPGTFIELYVMDYNAIGIAKIDRFYNGTDEAGGPLYFGGEAFIPWPIQTTGFSRSTNGPFPRPELSVSNVSGYLSGLIPAYEDLVGVKVSRLRTLRKYLDDGSTPDATAYREEIYYVNKKKAETEEILVFELVSAIDLQGKKLPGRIMTANVCTWQYKSAECSWPGTNPAKWYDREGNPVLLAAADICGKRLSDCKLRFGSAAELPYGAFPALGRT